MYKISRLSLYSYHIFYAILARINNDNLSNSSKNKKAKELGISIITESQFVEWLNNGLKPE